VSHVLVINASPLIFLGNAQRIDLLRATGAERIIVPDVVFAEVTQAAHTDTAARVVAAATWIERAAVPVVPPSVIEWDLGPGESAVIALTLQLPDARAVIDDLSARKCALALGASVMGTLGIVIAAHRHGVVPDPREILIELRAAGMWLSDTVIDRALHLAGVK